MTIEELLGVLAEKGAGILQTSVKQQNILSGQQDLWAILPDGRQYYLGVSGLVLQMPVSQFKKTDVFRLLSSSEREIVERKAEQIAKLLLSQAGLDMTACTLFAQTTLRRLLHGLLDEVYGDRREGRPS